MIFFRVFRIIVPITIDSERNKLIFTFFSPQISMRGSRSCDSTIAVSTTWQETQWQRAVRGRANDSNRFDVAPTARRDSSASYADQEGKQERRQGQTAAAATKWRSNPTDDATVSRSDPDLSK